VLGNELNRMTLEQTGKSAGDQKSERLPPIFVTGVWRSGTTLLYTLLNQHPDIRLFYEGDLPVLWPMFRLPWMRKAWVEKWEYWDAGVSRHDLDPLRLASPITSLAEAAELAGREYCSKKGAKIWGCKSPSYYDRLEFLAREFPKARFIVIWRDPEDICRSVIRAAASGLWFTRPGMTHKALLASETLKRQCDRLMSKGASLHQVYYRDLVDNPNNTMRGICEFLEVKFTPVVTVLNQADRSAVFEGAHHSLAKGNRIVSRKEPKGALPPALANKILRYKALWKAKVGDDWLLCQRFSEIGETKPGIWERITDRLLFMALRLWDNAPRICFSILPTAVWQAYRRLKYKDSEWVHRQLTNKPTTLHSDSGESQPASHSSKPGVRGVSREDIAAVNERG
jgi:Sulfotransferase family